MMNPDPQAAKQIFLEAIESFAPAEWAAFVNDACGEDHALRRRVEALLEAHVADESLLDRAAVAFDPETQLRETLNDIPHSHVGSRIGSYKLLQRIGEGGMGVVYMAEQTEPVERRVALKIIRPGMGSRRVIARFEVERQTLAMMDHPNIARIFDAGTTKSGSPYFVMELVKGIPITEYCDQHRLEPRKRLSLFRDVCHAVQHAHLKGVIHRDLKPSNVLVAEYDDQPVPKVIDFGVAKATQQVLTKKTMFTELGHVIGTFEYMSPEQAKLNQLDIDSRSDVYSLGILLYELLTGETPFDRKRLRSAAIDEVLRIIREEEPSRPSLKLASSQTLASTAASRGTEAKRLSGLVRGDLDWVVMKALEKDRSRRYDTASALARDIDHFLADEPVAACPPSVGYRFRKFAHRNKGAIVTTSLVMVCLLLGLIGTSWQAVRATRAQQTAEKTRQSEALQRIQAERQRDRALRAEQLADTQAAQAKQAAEREREERNRAEAARKLAEEAEVRARQNLYASHINLAQKAWEDNDILRAQDFLERHVPGPDEPDWRTFEWYYLLGLCNRDELTLESYTAYSKPAFSPDGKLLAVSRSKRGVSLWDLRTHQMVRVLDDQSVGGPLAFSPDGSLLASISQNRIQLWDPHAGTRIRFFGNHNGTVSNLLFTPDGSRLVSSCGGTLDSKDTPGIVQVFDVESGEQIYKLGGHTKYIYAIALSPDGNQLISSNDEELLFWDLANGRQAKNPGIAPSRAVAWSPRGNWIATSGRDDAGSHIAVWDVISGKLVKRLNAPDDSGWLCFSPEGNEFASVHGNSTVMVCDVRSGQLTNLFKGHSQWMFFASFSSDGQKLVTYGRDGLAKIWPLKVYDLRQRFAGRIDRSRDFELPGRELFAVSGDGKFAAGLAGASKVELVPLASNASQAAANVPGTVHALAFHPNQDRLAVAHSTGLAVVHAETGDTLVARAVETGVYTLGFSPDGSHLAVGKQTGEIEIWKTETLEMETRLPRVVRDAHILRKVAFSPDGNSLAAITFRVGGDGDFFLWDTDSWKLRGSHPGNHAWLTDLAFSPDSSTIVVAEGNYYQPHDGAAVRFFNAASGRQLTRLSTPNSYCMAVAFSPDGETLATASEIGKLTFWDLSTHEERMTIGPPRQTANQSNAYYSLVATLSYSPDGKMLFAGDVRGRVTTWAAPSQQTLARIERTGLLRRARELAGAGRFDRAEEVMTGVIAQHDELQYHLQLGEYFAEQTRWTDAISTFRQVVDSGTLSYRPWYLLALAQLGHGDLDAYQDTCGEMLERFAETYDSETAEFVAWTCVLRPCPDLDGDSLLRLASLKPLPQLGAVLHRLGYHTDASTVLTAAQEFTDQDMYRMTPAYGLYFQSMAHAAINQLDEAQLCLREANQHATADTIDATGHVQWNRRITLHILREEAELAIKTMGSGKAGQTPSPEIEKASADAHALAMQHFELSKTKVPGSRVPVSDAPETWKAFVDRMRGVLQQPEIVEDAVAVGELVAQVRQRFATDVPPKAPGAHALRDFGTNLAQTGYREEGVEMLKLAAQAFGLAAREGIAGDALRASQAHCLRILAFQDYDPLHAASHLKDAEQILSAILQDGEAADAPRPAGRVLGEIRAAQGRTDEAKRLLERATDLDPSDPWCHSCLLGVYLRLDKTPVADTLVRAKRAIDDHWQHEPIRPICRQLADKLAREAEWAAAAVLFRWLQEKQPTEASLIVSMALCDWMSEDDDRFPLHYRAAMQLLSHRVSDSVSQLHLIALCCLKTDATEDTASLVSFARQIQVDESALPFWREQVLGTALLRDGQYEEAIAELRKVQPNPLFSANYPLAIAYQAIGSGEAANEQMAAGEAWFEEHVVNGTPNDWPWSVNAQIWRKEAHQRVSESL